MAKQWFKKETHALIESYPSHYAIFQSFTSHVNSVTKNQYFPAETDDKNWDGGCFYEFVMKMSSHEKRAFKLLINNQGITTNYLYKLRKEGMGAEKAEIVFVASAYAQKQPLNKFIEKYIDFANHFAVDHKCRIIGLEQCQDALKKIGLSLEVDSTNKVQTSLFNDEITEHTTGSYRRHSLIETIGSAIENPNHKGGHIVVRGDAGAGKTSLLAHVAQNYLENKNYHCICFFIKFGDWTSKTVNFIDSIYQQLEELSCFDLSNLDNPNTINEEGYGLCINKLFNAISLQICEHSGRPLVVVIDALDEISENDPSNREFTNLFYIPAKLPKNIYFVVSSRNNKKQNYNELLKQVSLDENNPQQKLDIRRFIEWAVEHDKKISALLNSTKVDKQTIVDLLCLKSEYRFVYLHFVFLEMRSLDPGKAARNIDHYVKNLPQGIDNYYQHQYNRLSGNSLHKKIALAGITAFYPRISLERLTEFITLNKIETHEFINRWEKELKLLASNMIDGYVFYKFSHHSFYEFMRERARKLNEDEAYADFFRKFSEKITAEVQINEQDSSVSYNTFPQTEMRREALRLILTSLLKSRRVAELKTLFDYLTNVTFCTELISLLENGDRYLIYKAVEAFDLVKKFDLNDKTELALLSDRTANQFVKRIATFEDDATIKMENFSNIAKEIDKSIFIEKCYEQRETIMESM